MSARSARQPSENDDQRKARQRREVAAYEKANDIVPGTGSHKGDGPGGGPGPDEAGTRSFPADPRSFLVRCFRPDDEGSEGVARAFLSDRYRPVDNLDVLTAALEGVKATGVNIEVAGCDLTDRRMYVRITAPEVQALAPTLLAGYRSPFSGRRRAAG